MRAFLLVLTFASSTAFAESGTQDFTSFSHNVNLNAPTDYLDFKFGTTYGQPLYSSQTVNNKIQFHSLLDASDGETFHVATTTDISSANQFLFADLKYSGAAPLATVSTTSKPNIWLLLTAGIAMLFFKSHRQRSAKSVANRA